MTILKTIEKKPARIFAIGDIHGCLNELTLLLDHLVGVEKITAQDLIVFIGDYVDRGPDSFGVVSLLIRFKQDFPNSIFLRGNHEDMLLELLGFEGSRSEVYLKYGGLQCLASYKLLQDDLVDNIDDRRQNIKINFPVEHLDFLIELDSYATAGDYIFAHAGLNLEKKLEDQVGADLFWIREPFLSGKHQYGKTIIYGHTNFEVVKLDLPYKIGIDTGLVYGNKLSCVELIEKRVLSVSLRGSKVSESILG